MAKQFKLKDNHPTMIKLNKLFELADELGVSISFYGHRAVVNDIDRSNNDPILYLEDIEDTNNNMAEFPPATEFKVVYSK